MKDFDKWNEVKKKLHTTTVRRSFKNRDIFYMKMGQNVGFEQNGKGNEFIRPVVILKKITNDMFIGIPLSTQLKDGSWFYKFSFNKNVCHSFYLYILVNDFNILMEYEYALLLCYFAHLNILKYFFQMFFLMLLVL